MGHPAKEPEHPHGVPCTAPTKRRQRDVLDSDAPFGDGRIDANTSARATQRLDHHRITQHVALPGALVVRIGDSYETIVVDTGSTDGSRALVRERFPHVHLVALDENLGYGGSLNEGIARESAGSVLLMNGDAWPRPRAVEALVAFAEHEPRAGSLARGCSIRTGPCSRPVRGFPTLWRLVTEYLFLRWLAPWSAR